jgi:hypothetical protein
MAGLNISTAALGGSTTIYSGPPPPCSYAPSIANTASAQSGYISPSDPPRQGPNIEKAITIGTQSLPSISEALRTDRDGPFAPPISTSQPSVMPHQQLSTPSSAIGHLFSDAPSGPSNPFSQPPNSALSTREQGQRMEPEQASSSFTILNATEPRPQASHTFGTPRSPTFTHGTSTQSLHHNQGPSVNGQYGGTAASPSTYGAYRSPFAYSTPGSTAGAQFPPPLEASRPPQNANIEEHRSQLSRSGFEQSYGDSVKRHLDVFDAQMTLEEVSLLSRPHLCYALTFSQIVEASGHTLHASQLWTQQVQQNSRSGYAPEVLLDLQDIDGVLRQSSRAVEQLSRLREAVAQQQQLLADQQARALKGERFEDEFHGYHDDYKGNGGFAGGDVKKRRGVS